MKLTDLQKDPAAFRSALLIDTDTGPRPFSEVMDPWQRADFEALDPGWRAAVGQKVPDPVIRRAWLERPRGHSKTLDLACMSLWALFASKKRLSGLGAAVDQDQSRLLRDACSKLLQLNTWLQPVLEVQNSRILNKHTESTLELIAHDVAGSWGTTPDFVIADEACHWPKRDLWDSLISSAAKRSRSMFVTITNAGLMDDWCWEVREKIRQDPRWHFSRLDGPQASWLSPETLAEQEHLLPPIAYARLWLNQWSSGGGDAITVADLTAAFKRDLKPLTGHEKAYRFVAGVDLGLARDASAVVTLGVHMTSGRIRLAETQLWKPAKGERVNLEHVEQYINKLDSRFHLQVIGFDPWQAENLAQRLERIAQHRHTEKVHFPRGRSQRDLKFFMHEIFPSTPNMRALASTMIEAFRDRRLDLYPDDNLRRDLTRLRVVEKSYGFRLESPRDVTGHGDMASAFSMALLVAHLTAGKKRVTVGGPSFHSAQSKTPMDRAWKRLERNNEHEQMIASLGYDEPLTPFLRRT
jgi:hypothetical protein